MRFSIERQCHSQRTDQRKAGRCPGFPGQSRQCDCGWFGDDHHRQQWRRCGVFRSSRIPLRARIMFEVPAAGRSAQSDLCTAGSPGEQRMRRVGSLFWRLSEPSGSSSRLLALIDGARYLTLNKRLEEADDSIRFHWLLSAGALDEIRHAGPVLVEFPDSRSGLRGAFGNWLITRDQQAPMVSWLWSDRRSKPCATITRTCCSAKCRMGVEHCFVTTVLRSGVRWTR
ncbi:hypothetical protein EMIT0324P_60056 [Pseudomonas chlororaphis]